MPSDVYQKTLYKRGFITSERDPAEAPAHWRRWSNARLSVAFDPDLDFQAEAINDTFLLIFGKLVLLDHQSVDQKDIALNLLQALMISEERFFSVLEGACGRFACIFSQNGQVKVLNDACGMRRIFYGHSHHTAIASHAELLARHLSCDKSESAAAFLSEAKPRTYNMSFLPGFATTYDKIKILCPNTYFNFEKCKIYQYYPSQKICPLSDEDIILGAGEVSQSLAKKLMSLSPLAVSLTAGLDSRFTLAASCQDIGNLQFFTYIRKGEKINIVDAAIASRLAADYHLQHKLYLFNYELTEADAAYADFQRFRRVASRSVEFEHFLPLAHAYMHTWPETRTHLRSNIGEMCRAQFRQRSFASLLSAGTILEQFSALYRYIVGCSSHSYVNEQFANYLDETHLEANLNGWDPTSLYRWEHLVGVWHGSLLLESDFSHDTVSIFNCRRLLALFAAGSLESQVSARLMRGTIESLAPELLKQPINPPLNQLTDAEVQHFGSEVFSSV